LATDNKYQLKRGAGCRRLVAAARLRLRQSQPPSEQTVIELVLNQKPRSIGSFEVGRVLPSAKRRMIGPFIFFDHMGPVDLPKGFPRTADVLPHPHIGLSTVTYLFAGEIVHRDSVGMEQAIRPGEMNWMIAGSGITHSERFEKARREGGPIHAIQSWVALPNGQEEIPPAFVHHESDDLPVHSDSGVWLRLLAGEAFGLRAAVKTHSPLFYVHVALERGARISLPDDYPERAFFLVSGGVEVDDRTIAPGHLVVLGAEAQSVIEATSPSVLMLLGGASVGHRFIDWNFVSSSRERIEQARADWRSGRMKLPDLDNQEFVPLPSYPRTSAAPMS
jgi:redox-sensitive bicupin YhaK (pirin superfamily)